MRVLLVGEAVTLAHVARPLALADGLRRHGVSVDLAFGGERPTWPDAAGSRLLEGIGASKFAAALRQGRPVLSTARLRAMVEADRALLRELRPDLVIGDFRLSLSVSARVEGVPYATLTNAYWSAPEETPLPVPVLPGSRWLPLSVATGLFRLGQGWVLPLHCAPMNRVRREFGLPSLGSDLRRVYSDADHVLLADVDGMFDDGPPRPGRHFLGPVLWAPPVALPPWWSGLAANLPAVYVTMGSSGAARSLATVLKAMAGREWNVLAATAAAVTRRLPAAANIHLAPYLPGDQACTRATVVVSNGGSMSCQQAFVAGKPVLGIASNMDQFLNMSAVVDQGAGICMRADRVTTAGVAAAVKELADNPSYTLAARRLGDSMRRCDAVESLVNLLPALAGRPA